MRHEKVNEVLYSRLLVLEALEATQLSSVDLIHVQIAVYLQLVLTDAERHRESVCVRERQQTHTKACKWCY